MDSSAELAARIEALERQLAAMQARIDLLEHPQPRAEVAPGVSSAKRDAFERLREGMKHQPPPFTPPQFDDVSGLRVPASAGMGAAPASTSPTSAPTGEGDSGSDLLDSLREGMKLQPPPFPPPSIPSSTVTPPAVPPIAMPTPVQPPSYRAAPFGGVPAPDFRNISVAPRPEPAAPAFDFTALLARMHMLPPSGEGGMESQVGRWWATRIGVLLLTIGGVFFAVYVSRGTPPWVKFSELLAGSLGIGVLGLWLERRYVSLGRAIFAGGAALVYFCAFAAYVVPPVRVLPSATWSAFLQMAIAGGIFAAAIRKKSEIIALLAVTLGYVACYFSFFEELHDFALTAALLLGGVASMFYARMTWRGPMFVAVPASYLLYMLVQVFAWSQSDARPGFWGMEIWLLAYMAVFAMADYASILGGRIDHSLERRLLFVFNSSAAAALGFVAAFFFHRALLDRYYFLFGATLLCGSAMYWAAKRPDALMQVYFTKGTALVALGLCTALDARTRWIAVGAQAFVLLWSAKRSGLAVMRVLTSVTWLASLLLFLADLMRLGVLESSTHTPPLSRLGISSLLYLVGSSLYLAMRSRVLDPPVHPIAQTLDAAAAPSDAPAASAASAAPRRVGLWERPDSIIFAIALGVAASIAAPAFASQEWGAIALAAVAVAIAAVALPLRDLSPIAAGVVPFIVANGHVWVHGAPVETGESWTPLFVSGGTLIALTIAMALGTSFLAGRMRDSGARATAEWGEAALHAMWMFTLQTLLYKSLGFESYLAASVAVSLALGAAAIVAPLRRLADVSALPMALGLGGLLLSRGAPSSALPMSGQDWLLAVAALGAHIYAAAFSSLWVARAKLAILAERVASESAHMILATAIGVTCVSIVFDGPERSLAFVLCAACVLALERTCGIRGAAYVATVWLGIAHLTLYLVAQPGGALTAPRGLAIGLFVGALTLAMPLAMRRVSPSLARNAREAFEWLMGFAGLALIFMLFWLRSDALEHYLTVIWGLCAIAVLIVGLAARARSFRIVGLTGLALCVPRVFLVDVRETLYRIVAFIALGAVFLLVAFLYNKFKGRMEDGGEKPAS